MKIRRRALTGAPLLIAGAGAAVAVSACETTTGNLIAPPQVELCLEVEPEGLEFPVNVSGTRVNAPGCEDVYVGEHLIQVDVEGYEFYEALLVLDAPTEHTIALTPDDAGDTGDTGSTDSGS